ncbi:nuclear inhibitor of protein phosphatase 1-like isoform X2 [Montipora foliosa]|uniref:nuclear inhibitor of protein phosphatase 1-like isoform X2 n=2 Tax=Montipora TaxID=46703 RepID=UPI0035F1BBF6
MAVHKAVTPASAPAFEVPSWAGKPPQGLHLDVMKQTTLVEKLIIDQKSCYLFGRNKEACDFSLEHTSCSRVHAALVFHRHLNRSFLIDLKSTHGTFIGTIRLEPQKPTQVQVDSVIRFGASTRSYVLREKPAMPSSAIKLSENVPDNAEPDNEENAKGGLLGLPESDTDLDDLTEFNTAHNKRISSLGIEEGSTNLAGVTSLKRKRKTSLSVAFREGEEILNPEDIDPTVGKFRNMIQTTLVIPNKKMRGPVSPMGNLTENITRRLQSFPYSQGLYSNLPGSGPIPEPTSPTSPSAHHKPRLTITSAPDVSSPTLPTSPRIPVPEPIPAGPAMQNAPMTIAEAPKKKYAKEAWPGKKPTPSLLI